MTEIKSSLDKMGVACEELNKSDMRFNKILKNFLDDRTIKKDDLVATFRRLIKARTTYENRLVKSRMELEILAKEFKELETAISDRCQEALTRREDERVEAERQAEEAKKKAEAKVIDVRQFVPYSQQGDTFKRFVAERVRRVVDGYICVANEQVSIKEIHKCYKRWAETEGVKRLEMKELEARCEELFGDSKGKKIYCNIRVFMDDEEVEQFDKENSNLFDDE